MFYLYLAIAVIGLIIAVGVPIELLQRRRFRNRMETAFEGRQELTDRDFYEKFFAGKGIPFYIVKKIREIFEGELNVDLSRLLPDDDFNKNLSFFREHDSLADLEILLRLEEEFEIEIPPDVAAGQLNTFEGIADLVWKLVKDRKPAD